MRGGTKGMRNCLTGLAFTKEAITKLRKFYMAQQELCQELLVAQPLGICKITTYVDPKLNFKSLDITWPNGKSTTRTATILTSDDLRETL